jgi:hypothetical protein
MKWIVIALLFSFTELKAQEEQLILRIPGQSEKNVMMISRQLNCLPGLHFSGYAKDVSCLLLRYDTDYIKNTEIITTTIHHLNKKLKVEVITGVTAYDVIDGKLPLKE